MYAMYSPPLIAIRENGLHLLQPVTVIRYRLVVGKGFGTGVLSKQAVIFATNGDNSFGIRIGIRRTCNVVVS